MPKVKKSTIKFNQKQLKDALGNRKRAQFKKGQIQRQRDQKKQEQHGQMLAASLSRTAHNLIQPLTVERPFIPYLFDLTASSF